MWKVGDRVLGRRHEDVYWYPGTVRHIDGDRCYVIFDDGEDALVGRDNLRAIDLQVGDRVFARTAAGRAYTAASVTGRKGDELRLQYDDGTSAWTPLALVRVRTEASPPPPAAAPEGPPRAIGERVLACWDDLYWYPGMVFAVTGEQYHVIFDDGNQALVRGERLRPLTVKVGDRVWCRWQGGPAYHAGVIASKTGEVIHVNYDDGDEENTLLRLVRLERDDWLPAGEMTGVAEGSRVLACWFDQNWYPGVVVSVHGKRLHILFDDGDQAMVTPDRIKPLELKVGDRVCVRHKGGPIYYPGEITRISGEVIQVSYDDGVEETTSIRFLRIEREGLRDAPEGFE